MKFILILFIFTFNLLSQDCPFAEDTSYVIITRILDGDTYEFEQNNQKFKIRLSEVDCFETRRGKRLEKQAKNAGITPDSALILGKIAKILIKNMILNQKVMVIRAKQQNMDRYNRLVREVYFNKINIADTLTKLRLTI